MKDLLSLYLESTAEFSAMLKERTPGEVAYDNAVMASLRKGASITKALKAAAEQYPAEALQWDDETIHDIKAHYEYLMNHEDILVKLERLSNAK
jgi:hypothetical protein